MPEANTLGQLASTGVFRFGDGYRTKKAELGSSGFRIIRVADIQDGSITFDSPEFVSCDFKSQIGAKRAVPGDVLLTTKGTVGRVAIVPENVEDAVYSPQLCWFRVTNMDMLHPRFLNYWFKSKQFFAQASYLQGSTDMAPYISLSDLRKVQISLPTLAEQRAIAEVLGALDDKIAANTRLAATADELASAKFIEARKHSRTVKMTFHDAAIVGGGGTPSTKRPEYWNGNINWATPTDVSALQGPYLWSTERKITETGLAACSSPLYPERTILMTSRAGIGAFAIPQQPTAVNQGFITVQSRGSIPQWWLFHDMRSRVAEFLSWANGATFLELSRGTFKQLQATTAEEAIMSKFAKDADSLHAVASAALRENRTLAETRDALLPRLMSGELRVRDVEI